MQGWKERVRGLEETVAEQRDLIASLEDDLDNTALQPLESRSQSDLKSMCVAQIALSLPHCVDAGTDVSGSSAQQSSSSASSPQDDGATPDSGLASASDLISASLLETVLKTGPGGEFTGKSCLY